MRKKIQRRRSSKPRGSKPRPSRRQQVSDPHDFEPRVNRKLQPILNQIGVPEGAPFTPDYFQVEAVERLQTCDVVVSAPTGSGKTWIAEKAIEHTLAKGQKAWYASPLKALSNAKYADFMEIFGEDRVGILTGERKEKTNADLVVGTTEILRNQLYDAMNRGRDLDAGLVVLDEAHFLGDPDRGVVWEEVIIYLPPRVRLLLLSATVQNAAQISRWLTFVRDEHCDTVFSDERPVPLFPVFLFPDGELTPLTDPSGLFPKVRHFVEGDQGKKPRGPIGALPRFDKILAAMENADLMPAIFFLKSRSDCDRALGHVGRARLAVKPEQRLLLNKYIDEYIEKYPFLDSHPQLEVLRSLHVAAHHAGHLPHWKLLVERLMQKGLLKAIFSTSTVAAGVNFPARTVVATQSDRFNGREFVDLTAMDLLQMTGRAGRRGMDNIGFCLVAPGPFNNVPLVAGLLKADPEPILSQLSINFGMVLNLLLSHRPAEVKQLLGLSLATFQRLERSQGGPPKRGGVQEVVKPLAKALAGASCPGPEEAVIRRRRRRQLSHLSKRLSKEMEAISEHGGSRAALIRGRVFTDIFGSPSAVLRREGHEGEPGVLAVSLAPEKRLFKGRPRLDFVPFDEISGVFQEVLNLPRTGGGRVLARAVLEQMPDDPTPLPQSEIKAFAQKKMEETRLRLESVESELDSMPCRQCPSFDLCADKDSEVNQLLDRAERVLIRMQEESHVYWYDFVRHLEFLRAEGFVDPEGVLTQDGVWASKLRLDQPVLIAEAIRRQALPDRDPVLLSGLLALFVDDREREGEGPYLSPRLKKSMTSLQAKLDSTLGRMRQWGFDTPRMPLQAAAAVFAWALGGEFAEVAAIYGAGEGDLAQLIYRTADNLRQVISLDETHVRLSACAREAVDLLLRPPVVVPV